MKKLLLILLFVPLVSFAQEVTQADYNKYIYNSDYSYIQNTVSDYGVLISFQRISFRVYRVGYVLYGGSSRQSYSTFDINHLNNYMSFEDFVPYEIERRKRYKESLARKQKINEQKEIEEKRRFSELKSRFKLRLDSINTIEFIERVPAFLTVSLLGSLYDSGSFGGGVGGFKLNVNSSSFNENEYLLNFSLVNQDLDNEIFLKNVTLNIKNVFQESERIFFINDCEIESEFFNKLKYTKSAPAYEKWKDPYTFEKELTPSKAKKLYLNSLYEIINNKFDHNPFPFKANINKGLFYYCDDLDNSINEKYKNSFKVNTEKFVDIKNTLGKSFLFLHRKLLEGSLTNALDEIFENHNEWTSFLSPYLNKFYDDFYYPKLELQINNIRGSTLNNKFNDLLDIEKRGDYITKNIPIIKVYNTKKSKKTSRFLIFLNGNRYGGVEVLNNKYDGKSMPGSGDGYYPLIIEFNTKERTAYFFDVLYNNISWKKIKNPIMVIRDIDI
jgi:hypothetical protein